MENPAAISGSPGLLEIGGKYYEVAQPDMADAGKIAAFLQNRCQTPVEALRNDHDFELLPEDEQRQLLQDAARQKFGQAMPFDGQSILRALNSLEGVRFLAYVLIRKAQPSITWREITQEITQDNYLIVAVQLDSAASMDRLGNLAGRSGSPSESESGAKS